MRDWRFHDEQLLLNTFPIDKESSNYVRQVRDALFSRVKPTPLRGGVKLAAVSVPVLEELLNFSPDIVNDPVFLHFVSGSRVRSIIHMNTAITGTLSGAF